MSAVVMQFVFEFALSPQQGGMWVLAIVASFVYATVSFGYFCNSRVCK